MNVESVAAAFQKAFETTCAASMTKSYQAGEKVEIVISLNDPTWFDPEKPLVRIKDVCLTPMVKDENLLVGWNEQANTITLSGIPSALGERNWEVSYSLVDTSETPERLHACHARVFAFRVSPDPKTLWKDLPTDANEPYQADNTVYDFKTLDADGVGKIVVGASKRGRSHAHYGKFRDDNFATAVFPETGWIAVVVSDGAGSAAYSREGSRITCETMIEFVSEKLKLPETNQKLDGLEKEARDKVLKEFLHAAAYKALQKIDEEAKANGRARKEYHATMLACLMRKMESNQWLVVSMGIGDGVLALIGKDDRLTLLNDPDSGEYAGQTRFITMNDVWNEDPMKRVKILEVHDFTALYSMTDGVSDPMFETENDLVSAEKWEEFQTQIGPCLTSHDGSCAKKLCDWLDFWSKGNHDDRTIVVVY